ncbi:DUF2057 family protein [Vibrio misgurnus]|uniref:DUF2057 family protein n=1 Tax=Vibrio misgurnus TaxID=2993714 RepID=UPI003D2C9FF1
MAKPDFQKGSETEIELPDGINQIVFKYQPQFEIKDSIKVAYGDVIIAKFESNSDTLSFELPKFKSYREAQQKISPLSWKLVKQDGSSSTLVEDKLISNGVQIGRNYIEESKAYNIAGGPAAIAVSYVTVEPVSPSINQQNPNSMSDLSKQNDSQLVDLLKTMYLKASLSERMTFNKWLEEQNQ